MILLLLLPLRLLLRLLVLLWLLLERIALHWCKLLILLSNRSSKLWRNAVLNHLSWELLVLIAHVQLGIGLEGLKPSL